MGNRILKESIHTSNTIAALKSWGAEVLFYRLVVACDDFGRFDGRAPVILGKCYPLVMDRVTVPDVEGWLVELESVNLIRRYKTSGGNTFLAMLKWDNHQRIRAKYSKYPQPEQSNLLEDLPSIDRNRQRPADNSGVNLNSDLNVNLNLKTSADDSESSAPSGKPIKNKPRSFSERLVDDCLIAFGKRYAATRGQEYPGGLPALREVGFGVVTKRLKTLCPDVPYRKADEAGKTAEEWEAVTEAALKVWGGYLDRAAQIDATAKGIPGKDGDWLRFPDTPAKFCGRISKLTDRDVQAAATRAADVAEARKNFKRANPETESTVRYGGLQRVIP